MVTLLAHADDRRLPTSAINNASDVDESNADTTDAAAAAADDANAAFAHRQTDEAVGVNDDNDNDDDNNSTHIVATPLTDRPPSQTTSSSSSSTQRHQPQHQALRPSTSPSSTTPTTTSPSSPSSPSPSSSASSSCDTTCIHIVDAAPADGATPQQSTADTANTAAIGTSGTSIASAAASTTPAGSQKRHQHQHHQRHHSTTGVIRVTDHRSAATASEHQPTADNGGPSNALPAQLGRTRSDDDCDYESVVLRVKSATDAASLDRSMSGGELSSASAHSSRGAGRPDIDQIRAFLESEYVPGADGCWTSTAPSALHRRDSFIHRSYNKKLLARKNAIDEMPAKHRPASLPMRRHQQSIDATTTSMTAETTTTTTTATTTAPAAAHTTTASNNRISEPVPLPTAAIKRDSFLRNSLNSIRRSFSIRSSSSKKSKAAAAAVAASAASSFPAQAEPTVAMSDTDEQTRWRKGRRKRTGGVAKPSASGTDESSTTTTRSFVMPAPPHQQRQQHGETGSSSNNNSYLQGDGYANASMSDGGGDFMFLNVPLENVRNQYGHSRNSSTSSCTSQRSTNSSALLSGARPLSAMAPLQSHHQAGSDSSATAPLARAPQRSPSHQQPQQQQQPSSSASAKIDIKSIKHLQTTPSSTPSPHARSPSPHAPPKVDAKKEKKRKELSSGRQKKFHRHFQQVAADEHVINYFSCALVSDILLQGHLYITNNYFAFYSNVFGFVTKLLIPTVSVVRISKEKTAKIIPNAVGVATADERHVFGSFMSREAAYRLMLSVWLPVAPPDALPPPPPAGQPPQQQSASLPASPSIRLPSAAVAAEAAATAKATAATAAAAAAVAAAAAAAAAAASAAAAGGSEISVEDDSSSAISGNESSALAAAAAAAGAGAGAPFDSTDPGTVSGVRHRNLVVGIDSVDGYHLHHAAGRRQLHDANGGGSMTTAPPQLQARTMRSPAPQMVSLQRFYEMELPPRLMYVGYAVTLLLLLLSVYLVWSIWSVSSAAGGPAATEFGAPSVNWQDVDQNIDVYAEVLKWQRQMQTKGADEAQIILNSNLEQIAKVRKSLETLSILIHDKSALDLHRDDVAAGGGPAADAAGLASVNDGEATATL